MLSRDKFDRYVSKEDRQEFFRLFVRLAERVSITTALRECSAPKDDKFLELAVDGAATLLVSGDAALLKLSPFRATSIMTPTQILELPDSAFAWPS